VWVFKACAQQDTSLGPGQPRRRSNPPGTVPSSHLDGDSGSSHPAPPEAGRLAGPESPDFSRRALLIGFGCGLAFAIALALPVCSRLWLGRHAPWAICSSLHPGLDLAGQPSQPGDNCAASWAGHSIRISRLAPILCMFTVEVFDRCHPDPPTGLPSRDTFIESECVKRV